MKHTLTVLTALLLPSLTALHAVEVRDLRCDYLANPPGIDSEKPRLSWKMELGEQESEIRGLRQSAYQVLVASSEALLKEDQGDLWDSGKVDSDQSCHVEYQGKPLESRMRCHWKVRIWNQDGKESAWSQPATWTMGLLKPADWQAKWITASKWFMPPSLRPNGLVVSAGGWADVDLGAALPIDEIRLYFTGTDSVPTRFLVEGADEPQFYKPQILVDRTAEDFQPAGASAQVFPVKVTTARHIRLRITGARSKGNVTVRQMEVMSGGRNVALMRPTREKGTAWSRGHAVFLVDGMPSANDGSKCPPDACPTTAAPLLRKTFSLQKPVNRATLYVAALGMADVTINGRSVTDAVLGPPFTDYTKRVVYLTHDITALLGDGENVIGATLGNGFFSTPRRGFGERHGGHGAVRVLIQTEIEYADGSRQIRVVGELKPNRVEGNRAFFKILTAGWPRVQVNGHAGQVITVSQTAQVLPLALDVLPVVQRELTYQRLIDAIHARKDHLGTGFVGLPFLLSTLTEHRETALANKIVNQQDYPGWKTLIHDGVLAEGWEGGGAQMPSCGGAIGMWLYQSVLGIRPDPAGPGFKKFILAPQPDPASVLTSARGSYDSVHGRIVSEWTCEKAKFTLHAVVPPNTTATVFVPAKDAAGVTESDKQADKAEGVKFLRMENNAAVYAIGSGAYRFESLLSAENGQGTKK
ncbi:MAG TPA: alpha-L-rhamnosidase N-terminal domain-containing protein [Planctomycetota bacterium]|jgi:hypothetical protein